MKSLTERFLEFLEVERKCSPATLSAYRMDLRVFTEFLTGIDPKFDISKGFSWGRVTSKTIDRYVLSLQNLKFKLSTINRKMAVVRAFYSYLVAEGVLRTNPAEERVPNYQPRQIPEILSDEIVEKVLDHIKQSQDSEAARDSALVTLLYSTGFRTSELVGLNLSDIRVKNGQVCLICHGRNGNERTVELEDFVKVCLDDYLENNRPRLLKETSEEALFLSKHGRRLSRAGIWLIIGKNAKSAGFEKKMTPRILRHTFTARMLDSGKALDEVQKLLGHINLASTRVYRKPSGDV